MVMPAVSPSATDCFMRASSASRPALVKPTFVGSATAVCGQAGSDAADRDAGDCACAVTTVSASANRDRRTRWSILKAVLQTAIRGDAGRMIGEVTPRAGVGD